MKALLADDGQIVRLIKPQFEAGREKVGKKGVVREKNTHLEVIEKVIEFAVSIGFEILNLEYSPIKGPEGNIEYLSIFRIIPTDRLIRVSGGREKPFVDAAHGELDK